MTYDETGLDFSERHLAYFSFDPVTDDIDPSQVGEGIYILGKEDDPNARFRGGRYYLSTCLFSQGAGPVPEEMFPYRGVNENGYINNKGVVCLFAYVSSVN